MSPSSRTPEGDPLRCPVCGALTTVDLSNPPGDSVCPICGSHAWSTVSREEIEAAGRSIREFVKNLAESCTQRESLSRAGQFLVAGLVRCLAAYNADFWVARKRFWWQHQMHIDLVASTGPTDLHAFAREVLAKGNEMVRSSCIHGSDRLILGVPVRYQARVIGAITIVQRPVSSPVIQRGYLRFIGQAAELIGNSPSLTP
jgi:hypothetical protein